MVERFEKFSYLISELSKLLHKIETDELESLGIKGPYAIYILTIAKHAGGITANELAKICSRDKSDVSRALSALIDKGVAKKDIDEGKKYKALISLTERGVKTAESISQKARCAVEFASEGVSEEDRKIFYETLEIICSNMTKMSLNGVPKQE